MELKLKRIFNTVSNENNIFVNYENHLAPRRIFKDGSLERLFEEHEASIMEYC